MRILSCTCNTRSAGFDAAGKTLIHPASDPRLANAECGGRT